MRVLIITKEVWRNDQNGGNTLTWMFSRFPSDTDFAHVYCSEGMPDNQICNKYFKISTRDVVRSIKRRKKDAGEVVSHHKEVQNQSNINRKSLLSKITNSEILRDVVWKTGFFKSNKLKKYISDYNPDIIYAPGYGVNYMNYLIRWISTFAKCPIVSLISDDYYSFHQHRINPLYWLYLLNLRHNVRLSTKAYSLIYTMTDMQKEQLEKDFDVPVKLIRKGYEFDENMINNRIISDPIRIIHVGNIYHNRWKTIKYLAECINRINKNQKKYQLEIVTSYGLDNKIRDILEERNVIIHTNVSESGLKQLYKDCDIALHVESFDLVNRLKMQMSFSTKIIEYLASGCAIMMVCDERQSTYRYLKKDNLAIFVNSLENIEDTLTDIYDNKTVIDEKRNKAFIYGKENHSIEIVSNTLYSDFINII